MGAVVVKRGRAKPLWKGHPWVFRDTIERVDGDPAPGDLVTVRDPGGKAIGCGFFSPDSRLAVRLLAREERIETDAAFFRERLADALRLREETLALPVVTDAYRLVHSEGDRLPGLVVDRFAGHLVVQFSTIGMHRRRDAVLAALDDLVEPASVFEQPDAKACRLEGIDARPGFLRGAAAEPPVIREHGVAFRVGLGGGQKTGFFTDQRDNRQTVARLARDRRVLDLYTYTGGFALYAAVNGAAEVTAIDSSGAALAGAVENAMLNHVRQVRFERGDSKQVLNRCHDEGRRFDLVVCDPPRLAPTRKSVPNALRAYRDLHLRALRVVEPGGLLAVASCSGNVSTDAFEQTVREAAYDVNRSVQVLARAGQAADHPVLATCPEGRYLDFLLLCVT